ncbi:MAG: aspartate/glutamate racemase family protein [Halioglobus sp.]|nr:aspartate/glutamate racemase family protein [Halioglobus sp.]
MKKIGVVGGVGWPSTIEYYRLICEASQLFHKDKDVSGPVPMPEISIESLDMSFTVNNRGSSEPGSWKEWDEYFNSALKRLVKCGAELILIASVTPHTRLKEISKGIHIPVISIYDSVGSYCNSNGIKDLLVLGTMPTMNSPMFKDALGPFGVNVSYPETAGMKEKIVQIIERLYQNQTDGAASDIDKIVKSCISEKELSSTTVCLGCTELPLAFEGSSNLSGFEHDAVRYLNSSVVHALSVFEACAR